MAVCARTNQISNSSTERQPQAHQYDNGQGVEIFQWQEEYAETFMEFGKLINTASSNLRSFLLLSILLLRS